MMNIEKLSPMNESDMKEREEDCSTEQPPLRNSLETRH
jgi:hypothetical protein